MKTEPGNVPGPARTDNLALIFQEVLTAIVRLRSDRQELTDAESFRLRIREALKSAIQDARNRGGYGADDIKMATLALVGFLDESILNTRNPIFAQWAKKPLQEELFGIHMAGELFFQNLDQLLLRNDSSDLADLLEVHLLCLLLGYGGRYAVGGKSELQSITKTVADRIRRIRGRSTAPFMDYIPEPEVIVPTTDPWIKRFTIGAIVCLALVVLLFVGFKFTLASGASDLDAIATRAKS